MLIQKLVRKDFKVITPYQSIQSIKGDLADKNALIVMEKGKYLGLLTLRDVVIKTHNLVIDCVLPKPIVRSHHFLEDVLKIMVAENTEALPVVDEGNFVGVVFKTDLMLLLCKTNEERQEHIRTIVHDLRNPIANIASLTEMLKFGLDDDKQELIKHTQNACIFANDIINDLLVSAEIEESSTVLKKQSTDIILFLKSCLHNISGSANVKDIEVKDALPATSFHLKIDTLKFKRAILNLLSNAVKLTPEGGYIKLSALIKNERITIVIADSGIGIPKSLQPIVFEKFTKAKRQGTNNETSTGLGMYITKQLIEQHNGKIWFESKKNKGSTFFIELKA